MPFYDELIQILVVSRSNLIVKTAIFYKLTQSILQFEGHFKPEHPASNLRRPKSLGYPVSKPSIYLFFKRLFFIPNGNMYRL